MSNKRVKNALLVLFAAVAVICCVIAFVMPKKSAEAQTLTLEGNTVELSQSQYGVSEKFVFTATVSFVNGNSAGLIFGAQDGGYYCFSMDRNQNSVVLTYSEESKEAVVLLEERFIGNDKMTDGEKEMVNPKVAALDKVSLKVIITPEEDNVYAEFYADNIRRFSFDGNGCDVVTDLNALSENISYNGGYIGYACADAKVNFEEIHIGTSDYSYYSELYRQQYHYSQPAHWNNDPNGLVYYNGYYHLYYQHYPFANVWGDMYWGHARSKDLAHWENLPICLYPDKNFDGRGGDGYMWSGSAMVYRVGTSATIDAMNWYPNGDGTGLLGFYTRDGQRQDQVIMSSDDGGLSWTKRKLIKQDLVGVADRKIDCRDPKVFPVQYDGANNVIRWGMALTGMGTDDIWFLQSTDLYNWSYGGGFKAAKPECPDVVTLRADDGTEHTVMTFTGRQYLVGEISYGNGQINFTDLNGKLFSEMQINEIPFRNMDFGPDSYATQSYYIDDEESEYYGKTIAVSWFSGVPGHEASIDSGILSTVRKIWNGGGFTVPVEYGLVKDGNGYMLTQTPIVKNSDAFAKTEIYSGSGVQVNTQSENILKDVNTSNFELEATVVNPDSSAIRFLINMNGNEYTEIGWNSADGYYVDRTNTGDAGLKLNNYKRRYVSGAADSDTQSFYILSDNGSVEVYCGGYRFPFYVLTFSSPYAKKAMFIADGDVTADITVNEISTTWRDTDASGTLLYVESEELILDKLLTPEAEITAYAPYGGEISWAVESGAAVEIEKTSTGAKIKSVSEGTAVIAVSCGDVVKKISVTVYGGNADTDMEFVSDGKVSGNWYMSSDGIIGIQQSGDGFMLSDKSGSDFTYAANFNLSGAAAAIVFRAKADMSDYLIANYDHNGRIVKLWSPRGEIANRVVDGVDVSDILLTVKAQGEKIYVYINGNCVIDATLGENEPREGLFGLNACAARVIFKSVALPEENYTYSGSEHLQMYGEVAQTVKAIYNKTDGNVLIPASFYTSDGRKVILSGEYFSLLSVGTYELNLYGTKSSFSITVNVTNVPEIQLKDITLEYGSNAVLFIGNLKITQAVLNGSQLSDGDYTVKDGVLTVKAEKLTVGENTLTLSADTSVKITVQGQNTVELKIKNNNNNAIIIGCSVAGGVVLLGAIAFVTVLVLRRQKANGGNN